MINGSWFRGCDKLRYAYAKTTTDEFGSTFESLSKAGVMEFRTETIELPERVSGKFAIAARLSYVLEDMRVYVTGQSYEELIDMFSNVDLPWKLQIFDKDGNQLICSEENGSVVRVVDAEGNIIWAASAN